MKPKVGILTSFTGSDMAYSLVVVVRNQLQMLINGDYDPVLFTAPSFKGDGVYSGRIAEIRHLANPDVDSSIILDALRKQANDIQVMLCHDIIFLGQNQEWGKAARVYAKERRDLAWLHWQHSRGDSPVEPIHNSWYCYPNKGDLEHVAKLNSTSPDRVIYIPHPLDFEYLGWPELALRIAEDYRFPFVDVSLLYPSRLDRQKQLERLVRIAAGLKRAGRSICFLMADAYATGERFKHYKKELLDLAKEQGLNDKEFAFLGEVYEECTYATPRPVVKALLEMSNLFIQPSNAETSSLVVMEAALAGNLCILNADFSPIHHLYGKALTLPFGSVLDPNVEYFRHIKTADGTEQRVLDPQYFWDDEARKTILPSLDSQITISVKRQQLRERWPNTIFKDYLDPLIDKVYKDVTKGRHMESTNHRGDPEVTAIICTIDNAQMLKKQIPILLDEVDKIIIVNNGSIDNTKEYVDSLADQPRIQAIHRDNLGAGPGRNAGLRLWDFSTPYTLMLDGGILPPRGGVKAMKDYLLRHEDVSIVSPEVATSFTDDELEACRIFPISIPDSACFAQCSLSGTAYALIKADAWHKGVFSEEGPFAEPGWGCDDNDQMFRWDAAGVLHHDYGANLAIKLLRKGSGSFQRLYKETGIWPNQYGSVYEKRNVMLSQVWRGYYDPIFFAYGNIVYSFILSGIEFSRCAKIIKKLHDDNAKTSHEVIVNTDGLNEATLNWLETFRLRWHHGDTTVDAKSGKIIHKIPELEHVWTGDIILDKQPRGKEVVIINKENYKEYMR